MHRNIIFSALVLASAVTPVSAANVFRANVGEGFLSGSSQGSLDSAFFNFPEIEVDEYRGLEAIRVADSTNLNAAATMDGANIVDLEFSAPVMLRFERAATNPGVDGLNFVFTPSTTLPVDQSFTFRVITQGWGPAFSSPDPNYTLGLNPGSPSVGTGEPNADGPRRSAFDFSIDGASAGTVGSALVTLNSLGGGTINSSNTPVATTGGPNDLGFSPSGTGGDTFAMATASTGSTLFTAPTGGDLGFAFSDAPGPASGDLNTAITVFEVTLTPDAGTSINPDQEFRISFDGAPVLIPEPSSALLGLLGLGSLLLRRRR